MHARAASTVCLRVRVQARQLQEWAQELQHRLAARPQRKLLLPPSISARHMGAALESVNLDVELDVGDAPLPLCWDVQASTVDASPSIGCDGGGSSAGADKVGRGAEPTGSIVHRLVC